MSYHPCGNIPLSTLSIHVHFCHYHQAWFGTAERWLQESDEVEVLGVHQVEFGPFDAMTDVFHWLRTASGELMTLPGRPWAS